MALTDPLGDMLTRIRNGQRARKDSVLTPASKLRARVLDVLQREVWILNRCNFIKLNDYINIPPHT